MMAVLLVLRQIRYSFGFRSTDHMFAPESLGRELKASINRSDYRCDG
jgi:hypothetical protein